jgi:hypothetical protein
MPNTLTLGGANAFNGNYQLTDGTSFNTSSGFLAASAPLSPNNNSAIITGTGVTNVAVDLGTGFDTLLINTTLTGSGASSANSLISLGGGNDSVTVSSNVTDYRIDGTGGNDTLVVGAVTITNGLITGGIGADSIVIGAGSTLTNSQISASTVNNKTDGNDTITIAAGSTATGSFITNFSKASDTLIIGGSTINSTDFATFATGTYGSFSLVGLTGQTLTDITALNTWLGGSNGITLI